MRYNFAISMPAQITGNPDRLDRCSPQTNSGIDSRDNKGLAFFAKDHPKMIRHSDFMSGADSSGKKGLSLRKCGVCSCIGNCIFNKNFHSFDCNFSYPRFHNGF